jgi:hypothetical protein
VYCPLALEAPPFSAFSILYLDMLSPDTGRLFRSCHIFIRPASSAAAKKKAADNFKPPFLPITKADVDLHSINHMSQAWIPVRRRCHHKSATMWY